MGILLDGGEEKMFDADIIVLELGSFLGGPPQKGLESGSDHRASGGNTRAGDLWESSDFRFEPFGEAGGLSAEFLD
jgi:hypothetical protein